MDVLQPSERVFDVLINGEAALSGYDIVERAGGVLRETVEAFEVDVKGDLTVTLRSSEGSEREPLINGMELIAIK